MIAVDSSILVGLIRGETDLLHLEQLPFTEEIAIAAPVVVESQAWCARNLQTGLSRWLDVVLAAPNVLIAAFTEPMALAAIRAFRIMGRGSGHPAALNFGDALVYGHASVTGIALLFKGNDFGHTDLEVDPRSVIPSP